MSLHISCTYLQIISEKELYFHQLLRFMNYVVGYPQQVFDLKPLILHVCGPRLGFSITWSYFQEVVIICERSSQIEKLRIPCFLSLTTAVNIQSHGYSNGSESRYAACIFLWVFKHTIRAWKVKSSSAEACNYSLLGTLWCAHVSQIVTSLCWTLSSSQDLLNFTMMWLYSSFILDTHSLFLPQGVCCTPYDINTKNNFTGNMFKLLTILLIVLLKAWYPHLWWNITSSG